MKVVVGFNRMREQMGTMRTFFRIVGILFRGVVALGLLVLGIISIFLQWRIVELDQARDNEFWYNTVMEIAQRNGDPAWLATMIYLLPLMLGIIFLALAVMVIQEITERRRP